MLHFVSSIYFNNNQIIAPSTEGLLRVPYKIKIKNTNSSFVKNLLHEQVFLSGLLNTSTKKNYLNVDVEKRDIFGHNEVLPLVEQIPQVSGWVYVRSASKDVVNAVDSAIMKPYNLRLTPPSSLALVSMENINTGVQACIVGRIICKLNNCLHINIQSFKSPGHKRSMGG
ncbi:hypothetical protein PPACK8108_LOCUS17542 [Phakopsora pachyrhizi]|uniref:Uncharacterized protein n=1 Tax=Phakopsora pachyrhizi TaxID=170000 RepID=A0AAV0BBV2_PHAPC|nr:hypothetical protein PPACK8108_LOCUS17542 [Phakopsora pachyrhizi]